MTAQTGSQEFRPEEGGEQQPEAPSPRLGKRLENAVPATTAIVNIIAIIGVCGGLYQYMDQGAGKRTEQSIQLVNVWETEKYKDKYEKLQSGVSDILDGLPTSEKDFLDSGSPDSREVALGNIGKRALTTGGADISTNVDDLFYYFNKTAICIEYSMCSKKASDAFLFETAKSFWTYFGWYALERREHGYEGFASEAEKFAKGELKPAWYSIFN